MLRKFSHIILSALLLVSTIGLAVSKHFCGGNYVSTSLFTAAKSCCDSDDCCKNESEVFQLHENFSITTITEVPESIQLEIFAFAMVVFNMNIESTENNSNFLIADSPPPPKIQVALSQRQTYLL